MAALLALAATPGSGQGLTIIFRDVQWSSATGISNYHYNVYLDPNTTISSASNITFFDFAGLTGTPHYDQNTTGSSFSVSTPFTGINPTGPGQADNPNIKNVSFSYSGTTLTNTSSSPELLGLATVDSTVLENTDGPFTEFGTNATSSQGGPVNSSGDTWGPNLQRVGPTVINTPEPGMPMLLGAALLAAGACFRGRRRST